MSLVSCLKFGDNSTMYHWTDSKIRIHAFYCMLGISLLQSIHKQAQGAWPGISMEKLIDELNQIQQFQLLYPAQGAKGPGRVATVLSKQSICLPIPSVSINSPLALVGDTPETPYTIAE